MGTKEKTKKTALKDWHRADIVAAIWKKGTSLRRLSEENGYYPTSLKMALHRPYPKTEAIIAEAIGLPPWAIWPSRYDENGRPNRKPGRPKSQTA
jgi:Ner family transcriptional regulator